MVFEQKTEYLCCKVEVLDGLCRIQKYLGHKLGLLHDRKPEIRPIHYRLQILSDIVRVLCFEDGEEHVDEELGFLQDGVLNDLLLCICFVLHQFALVWDLSDHLESYSEMVHRQPHRLTQFHKEGLQVAGVASTVYDNDGTCPR